MYTRLVPSRTPTRNPNDGVCANNYAMGAPITPILPTLQHGPPNALCRSVARNYQFPCQGNEIVGKGGGRGGGGTKVADKIGAPVSLLLVAFFGFSRSGFLAGILGVKKMAGNSPAGPLRGVETRLMPTVSTLVTQ